MGTQPLNQQEKKTARKRLESFAATSAQSVSVIVAVGTLYCLFPGDPLAIMMGMPILANLVEKIGGDVLVGFLQEVAKAKEPSHEELAEMIAGLEQQATLTHEQLQNLPTKRDFFQTVSTLSGKLDRQQTELVTQNQEVLALLAQIVGMMTSDQPTEDEPERLQNYLDWVQKTYSEMRVLNMTQSIRLRTIYRSVYLLDRQKYHQDLNIDKAQTIFLSREGHKARGERVGGGQLLKRYKRLFLIGQPGAGKSTFLRWIALRAARHTKSPAPNPLLVELRRYNSYDGTLFELIAEQLFLGGYADLEGCHDAVYRWLKAGVGMLLLDGLDEVVAEKRQKLNDEIDDLLKLGPNCYALLSSRPFAETRLFPRFQYVEMAEFERDQIVGFVQRWFDAPVHDEFLKELWLDKHKPIQELAKTPLLLTLMCIAFGKEHIFPSQREQLYRKALAVVLETWDEARGVLRHSTYGLLKSEKKQALLVYLAYYTFERQQFFIPEVDLYQRIKEFWQQWRQEEIAAQQADGGINWEEVPSRTVDAKQVLRDITVQHGLFVEQATGIYSFTHLTFQEYFTAKYIVQNRRKRTLESLITHAAEDQWQEVFLLTVSLLDEDADEFFELFIDHLHQLAEGSLLLRQLLVWAAQKTDQGIRIGQLGYQPSACRAYYHALATAIASAIAHASAHSRAHAHARANANALDHAITLDHALALDHSLARAQAQVHALARANARPLPRDLARARASASARAFAIARKSSHMAGFTELAMALDALSLPEKEAKWSVWKAFAKLLDTVIETYRNLSGLEYMRETAKTDKEIVEKMDWLSDEIILYADYLKATRLLVDCLPLAKVRDRMGIKDRLLMPPPPA